MQAEFSHSVIISFNYGIDSLDPLHRLGDRLSYVLDRWGEGYYDGHELAMDDSHGSIFLYGRNAEQLYKIIEPELFNIDWMDGALVSLRFGRLDRQAKSIEFTLEKI